MSALPDRETYRPSGRVRPVALLVYSAITLAVAVGLAWLLFALLEWGWYFVVIVPVFVTFIASAFLLLAVRGGHCRNRWVAGALGLLTGCVVYLGYYHIHLINVLEPFLGPGVVWRVDLLPDFIDMRIKLDDVGDAEKDLRRHAKANDPQAGAANLPKFPPPKDTVGLIKGWLIFGIELLIVLGFCTVAPWRLAGHPYSEQQGRWLTHTTANCQPGSGLMILGALRQRDPDVLAGVLHPSDGGGGRYCELTLFATPASHETIELSEVYLTIAEITGVGTNQMKREQVVQWLALEPAETAALAARFTAFSGALGLNRAPAEPLPRLEGRRASGASVQTIPGGGTLLSPGNLIVGSVYALAPIVGMFAGLCLAAYGVWDLAERDPDAVTTTADILTSTALIVGGPLLLLVSILFAVYFADYLPSRYLYRKLGRILAQRPDAVVEWGDPDAICVQIIPRHHWGKVMVENATDMGLLKLDAPSATVLYEGDRERWKLPVASLLSCQVEFFTMPGVNFAMVVLRADVNGQAWETPFAPRHVIFARRNAARQHQEAFELHSRILAFAPHLPKGARVA